MATSYRTVPTQTARKLELVGSGPSPEGVLAGILRAVRAARRHDRNRSLDGWQARAEVGRATGVRC